MEDPNQKLVVDEAMIRQFAQGQLDEATEDKIVVLLEKKPEFQAKVAAISIDPVIQKMRVHSQIVAARSPSSQFTESHDSTKETESEAVAPLDIPAELGSIFEFRVVKELGEKEFLLPKMASLLCTAFSPNSTRYIRGKTWICNF